MTRPDAYAVAAAMNARPLPADTDGGWWVACEGGRETCEECWARVDDTNAVACGIGGGRMVLCLPCAMADVQRAHAAADPHCTCPDCLESHADREVKS